MSEENKPYIVFGIVGLILAVMGAIVIMFSNQQGMAWALFGSGIAIIWVSFHHFYHRKRK